MTSEDFEKDDLHRRYNYEICNSIDLLKLGIVLEKMVKSGHIHEIIANNFEMQARGLLNAIRNENNRAFGKPYPWSL